MKKKYKKIEPKKKGMSIRDQILKLVYMKQGIPTTSREVADRLEISWKKASDQLDKLHEEGFLEKAISEAGTTYWKENE